MPGGAEDHVESGTGGKVELKGVSARNVKSFELVILTDPRRCVRVAPFLVCSSEESRLWSVPSLVVKFR